MSSATDRFEDVAGAPTAATRKTPPVPVRFPADRAVRWQGAGVAYRRRADGSVAASCLGVTGVGPTEGDALQDLERRLQVPPPDWTAAAAFG